MSTSYGPEPSSDILSVCETLRLGGSADDSSSVGRTLSIDFIGRSNIWIDDVVEEDSVALARHIICRALVNTAAGQLDIIGFDSSLSGVFAPFATLSSGSSRHLKLIQDINALGRELEYLRQQIQGVQNVIQGRARTLTAFRRQTGRPVEGYTLVVLVLDMGMISTDLRSKIALLMKAGPAAGVSFLVVSTTMMSITDQSGQEYGLAVSSIAPNTTVLEINGKTVCVAGTGETAPFIPIDSLTCLRETERLVTCAESTPLPVVSFDSVNDVAAPWRCSSVNGVTFGVGKYGVNDVEITLGDEVNQRHNALITGAVGQGKSNLISVIIHSLCLRYPPSELQLYLLDFKEGVTFKAFSSAGKEDYLPHAKVIGLESDVDYGIAVLESLFREYRSRMATLKEASVRSIQELRKKNPGIEMPRIVVIIDEFQMMFGDDVQTGQYVADLLEKSVRLFRAAGIHFILSSQTLGGNMALTQKKDSIFSQVPVRLALKNSLEESYQTLTLGNPAAAFLRPREAVVNLDYGEIAQNRKTIVAFADEATLAPLRRKWWERSRSITTPPYVFESERRVGVRECIADVVKLRMKDAAPCALIGDRISIEGMRLSVPLPAEPGRNIAIIGAPDAGCNQALGILQSAAVSLAYQHSKQSDARFIVCDFTHETPMSKRCPHFADLIEEAGFFVEDIPPSEFENNLGILLESADLKEATYVLGVGMDRWEYRRDPYGQGSPLKTFVESGPSKGLHFIGWWVKSSNFIAQVSDFGNSDAFNTKVFLRIDEQTVQSLTSPFVRWKAQSNRGLASDPIEYSTELPFVPYAPVVAEDVEAFRNYGW